MTLHVSINLNSLRIIKEELDSTINQASEDFEAFLADRNHIAHLNAATASIAQIGGIFRLLEYPGASLLAEELESLGLSIADPETKVSEQMIEAFTHNLVVLPRYIEYVTLQQAALPTLLIPYINEMRVARRRDLLPEQHFFPDEIPTVRQGASMGGEPQTEALLAAVPRLRHMFQVGLVSVITENRPAKHLYQLLTRPIERVVSMLNGHPNKEFWQLAGTYISSLAEGYLMLNLNRKRNLAEIEKLLRLIVTQGEEGLSRPAPEQFKKNLLFSLMLSSEEGSRLTSILADYALPELDMKDDALQAQRLLMHGPSLDTIESVLKVLMEELHNTRDLLEMASQNNSIDGEDAVALTDLLKRIADTLSILNLSGPMSMLREQLGKMAGWSKEGSKASRDDFLELADVVLFVESSLNSIDRREITVEEINKVSSLTTKKIVAQSHLAEAERLVLKEAEAGIAVAARAIKKKVDSNFESAHIANVAVTLNVVRGGLHMLNYSRAAAILSSCSAFIESHMKDNNAGNQRHQLLETLADALISLEYYLGEVSTSPNINEKILDVAEESLSALGFGVES